MHLPPLPGGIDDTYEGGRYLEREIRDLWFRITDRSFIIHIVPVWNALAGAAYMAKYFDKGFDDRREMEARGVSKRYTRFRWPVVQYKLSGAIEDKEVEHSVFGKENFGRAKLSYMPWYEGASADSLEAGKTLPETQMVSSWFGSEVLVERKRQKLEQLGKGVGVNL